MTPSGLNLLLSDKAGDIDNLRQLSLSVELKVE
jgi:hypothetical protein